MTDQASQIRPGSIRRKAGARVMLMGFPPINFELSPAPRSASGAAGDFHTAGSAPRLTLDADGTSQRRLRLSPRKGTAARPSPS